MDQNTDVIKDVIVTFHCRKNPGKAEIFWVGLGCDKPRVGSAKRRSSYLGHRWLETESRSCGISCLTEAVCTLVSSRTTALTDSMIWYGTCTLKFTFNYFHVIVYRDFQH